jgi:uncharacterized protein
MAYPPLVQASPRHHAQHSAPALRHRVAGRLGFRQIEHGIGWVGSRMAKKIRDTIHGYIYLTRVEEAVSQHPLVLRLHYVHQTSFTYLTYPNAHSTRYPHSLGVMHIASEIFSAALKNSDAGIVEELAQTVRSYESAIHNGSRTMSKDGLMDAMVNEVIKNNLTAEPVYAVWVPPQFKASITAPGAAEPIDANVIVPFILLHQAIRLAALLHDVGHPPFSHVVEYSLLEALPEKYKGHEPIGAEILEHLITDTDIRGRSAFQKFPIFSEMCLRLAQILISKDKSSSFYGLKRSLIDGPMDADRLDYVQRDIKSSGIVPAYDIRRLVDAAFFRKCGAHYEIGYQPNCLSAFENFFMARYDLYRWVIYHHDVVRRNLSIQRALAILLSPKSKLRIEIKQIGEDIAQAACGEARGYRRFVDSFLLDNLWRLLDLLEASYDPHNHPDEADLRFFLSVVLARRNDKLETILKRPDAYAELCKQIHRGGGGGASEAADRDSVKWVNDGLSNAFAPIVESYHGNENRAKLAFARQIEGKIQARVDAVHELSNVRVYAYYVGTFQAAPDRTNQLMDVNAPLDNRRLFFSSLRRPLEPIWARSVSPTIAMLEEAWSFSPQLLLFYTPQDGGRLAQESGPHTLLMGAVTQGLKDALETAA